MNDVLYSINVEFSAQHHYVWAPPDPKLGAVIFYNVTSDDFAYPEESRFYYITRPINPEQFAEKMIKMLQLQIFS